MNWTIDLNRSVSNSHETYLTRSSATNMLSLITALLAFSGAVVAVLLGQILEMYRSDLEEADEIIRTMKLADLFRDGKLTDSRKQQTALSLIEELQRIYAKKQYLLSDLGKRRIESHLDYIDSEISEEKEVSAMSQFGFKFAMMLDEEYEDIGSREESDIVREVTITGAAKRYLGNRSPYPRRFENDDDPGWTPLDE